VLARFPGSEPPVESGDPAAISVPLDFVGVNNYSRHIVRAGADDETVVVYAQGSEHTDMGWEVYPPGLAEVLVRLHEEYAVPSLYVTENGAAYPDVRSHDGGVHDRERVAYLRDYTASVADAIARGAPVRGYFVWSLLDNFEWTHGYAKRFGIVYVDYPTLERVPKDSFAWYREAIAGSRGAAVPSAALP
jgi:beta-glucosidase